MDKQERKSLAEQIITNPLTETLLAEIEKSAMETGISAKLTDDETRAAAMAEVRAVRAFRRNLLQCARDNPPRKGAPA